jgi:hypothetical protein
MRPTPHFGCGMPYRSQKRRATRRSREPPSDAEIERGLRERAVSDPRAAEILLRWLQRTRPPEATPGVDLDALSEAQVERLHVGLVRLASLNEPSSRRWLSRCWPATSSSRARNESVACERKKRAAVRGRSGAG